MRKILAVAALTATSLGVVAGGAGAANAAPSSTPRSIDLAHYLGTEHSDDAGHAHEVRPS